MHAQSRPKMKPSLALLYWCKEKKKSCVDWKSCDIRDVKGKAKQWALQIVEENASWSILLSLFMLRVTFWDNPWVLSPLDTGLSTFKILKLFLTLFLWYFSLMCLLYSKSFPTQHFYYWIDLLFLVSRHLHVSFWL